MLLHKIISQFNILSKFQKDSIMNSIHSVGVFQRIIEKEKDRSDRTGLDVSLVVFEAKDVPRKTEPIRDIIMILLSRLRSIDEIGWFDQERVGVVLPHTGWGDARKFAEIVQKVQEKRSYTLNCRIYTYPSIWLNGWNGKDQSTEQLQFSDVSEKWRPNYKSNITILNGSKNAVSSKNGSGQPKIAKCAHRNDEILLCDIPFCFTIPPFWKRALDIFGALVGIILLLPLFILIALIIKIVSPGPVFFKQERIGYRGMIFKMLKFRTMHVDAKSKSHREYLVKLINSDMKMTKLDESYDPRIFIFGKILRKTCLDELPQLINVLLAEMSLVGPRPCLPYEAEKFLQWYTKRFDALPGLTGLWQVSGKNKTTFKEMIRLDISYERKKSLAMDLLIIFKTIPTVVMEVAEIFNKRKETEYAEDF